MTLDEIADLCSEASKLLLPDRYAKADPVALRVMRALYDMRCLAGERDLALSRANGRTAPPTDEEIAAHARQRGSWLVSWDRPVVIHTPGRARQLAARCRRWNTPMRWVPVDAGGGLAVWPRATEGDRG